MKHLNTHSYCVENLGNQPVLAIWLSTEVSLESIMDLKGCND